MARSSGDIDDALDTVRAHCTKKTLSARNKYPAWYIARMIHLNDRGLRMDFTQMAYLTELYREISYIPKLVLEKGVQLGVSEMCIVESHREAGELGWTIMYVLPKYELRNRFVNNRIYKCHKRVKYYKHLIKDVASGTHRTSLIHFGRGTIAFVGSNVEDEFIEIPIDSAWVDEKDRCNQQNLLLLPDRYSASDHKYHREVSNPTVEGYGIDERYLESTQGVWMIECPACRKRFTPDFFSHVAQEVSPLVYIPRDTKYERGKGMRLIHDCGSPVDRLKTGSWVDAYPGREWVGRRVSKLFSKHAALEAMFLKWQKIQGHALKVQVFYNSELGLPYTSEGAKLSRLTLNACRRVYEWPMSANKTSNVRVMGVDVGADLNIVVRDMVKEKGMVTWRLLLAVAVPSFDILSAIIDEWTPRTIVIDAYPEIHKVMELKAKHNHVHSSRFQDNLQKMTVNRESREVAMDRTALLDYVKQRFEMQLSVLPMGAEFIDGGNYYSQLEASTRVLEPNEDNPERTRFVWVHSAPDHYFLAEAYCVQAGMLLPNLDVFDFFDSQAGVLAPTTEVVGITAEQQKEINRLEGMNSDMFLQDLQNLHGKRKK